MYCYCNENNLDAKRLYLSCVSHILVKIYTHNFVRKFLLDIPSYMTASKSESWWDVPNIAFLLDAFNSYSHEAWKLVVKVPLLHVDNLILNIQHISAPLRRKAPVSCHSKALFSQVHVVQSQFVYLTTVRGIKPGQVDCKDAEICCSFLNCYMHAYSCINRRNTLQVISVVAKIM